jgi:hypothetical protein
MVTEATGAGTSTLKKIDFGHHKEALVFDQNLGGRYDYRCCTTVACRSAVGFYQSVSKIHADRIANGGPRSRDGSNAS